MEPLTIANFAEAAGVGVETVRYYQRRGLLVVPQRGVGARKYGDLDLRRLHFIRAAQSAGFSLAEIAELLALDRTDDRGRAYEIAAGRIAALDERIDALRASRDALRSSPNVAAGAAKAPAPFWRRSKAADYIFFLE